MDWKRISTTTAESEKDYLRARLHRVLGKHWIPEEFIGPVSLDLEVTPWTYHAIVARIGERYFALGECTALYLLDKKGDQYSIRGVCRHEDDILKLEISR